MGILLITILTSCLRLPAIQLLLEVSYSKMKINTLPIAKEAKVAFFGQRSKNMLECGSDQLLLQQLSIVMFMKSFRSCMDRLNLKQWII
jgi:hypothetical protein